MVFCVPQTVLWAAAFQLLRHVGDSWFYQFIYEHWAWNELLLDL